MVLRAELFHEDRCIIGHTTEVGASSVFVRTDETMEIGARVMLRLSFPGLFAPLQVAAQVASREAGAGHGYYAGFCLDFAPDGRLSELQRDRREAHATGSCRILLVEDSPVMRDIIAHTAAAFSKTFQIATESTDNVESALDLLARNRYDLGIVDLYLAGQRNGADLVREMRTRKLDVPVIGFSVGGSQARLDFLDAGADLFLDKPVTLRDVFTTLERLLAVTTKRQM